MPHIACSCGWDLRRAEEFKVKLPNSFQKVAVFGHSIFRASQLGLSVRYVRQVLAEAILPDQPPYAQSRECAIKVMDSYGLVRSGASLKFKSPHEFGLENNLYWRYAVFGSSNTELCALASCLGFNYESLAKTVLNSKDLLPNNKSREMYQWEIHGARAAALRVVSVDSKMVPARMANLRIRRGLYWFLRLHDNDWLKTTFHWAMYPTIPSIERDREKVETIIRTNAPTTGSLRKEIYSNAAGVRGAIRDSVWLSMKVSELPTEKTQNGSRNKTKVKRPKNVSIENQKEIEIIEAVIKRLLASREKPVRIYSRTIAPLAGLPQNRTLRLINQNPALLEMVQAANADKKRRTLIWAVRQMNKEEKPLSILQISLLAGVSRTAAAKRMLKQILEDPNT
jgi:hypothetical protein